MTENDIIQRAIALGAIDSEPDLYALVPIALSRYLAKQQETGEFYRNNSLIVPTASITIGAGNVVDVNSACNLKGISLGDVPESEIVFSPVSGFASGAWTAATNPVEGETIVINGKTFTFRLPGFVLAGGGTAAVNGTYTRRGTFNGKYYYNLLTFGNSVESRTIVNGHNIPLDWWEVLDNSGNLMYIENRDGEHHDTPLDVTWTTGGDSEAEGNAPAPTITARTLLSTEFEIGATREETFENMAAALNGSDFAEISVATYEAADVILNGTYDVSGSAGLTFSMAASSAGAITVSGSTFSYVEIVDRGIKTVRFVKSRDRLTLTGRQDQFFTNAFLDGGKLYFSAGADPTLSLAGLTFVIRCVAVPALVVDLPDDSLMEDIAQELFVIAPKAGSQAERGLTLDQGRV